MGEELSLDLFGPLTISGRRHTWGVVVDRASRKICLRVFKSSPTSEVLFDWVESIIKKNDFATKGILTDCASQFRSRTWTSKCRRHSITPRFTAVNHPESDGITERRIQQIKEKIRLMLGEEGKIDLRRLVSYVTEVLNDTYSRAIGMTPNEASDILGGTNTQNKTTLYENTKRYSEEMEKTTNKKRKKSEKLEVGDSVLVQKTEKELIGMPISKAYYHGPYEISRVIGPLTFQLVITDRGRNKVRNYNRKLLKKYYPANI
jgi:Integrase core domain